MGQVHDEFRPASLLSLCLCSTAIAGPPFLADDPEPVDWHHYEAYVFSTVDRSSGSSSLQLPAVEFNMGAAPNLQLHIVIPSAYVTPPGAYGIGDVELGAKYRLVQETAKCPQIGVFPMLELPSGDSRRGLGNGQVWARLPVWVQKSKGPWTTYGGVGYQVNHAPGMKSSEFAGWLVQRKVTKRLVLGGEVYHHGPQTVGGRQATFTDAGGYYNVRENLSVLFMFGHTVSGERHTVGYLGLYYKWGGKSARASYPRTPNAPRDDLV